MEGEGRQNRNVLKSLMRSWSTHSIWASRASNNTIENITASQNHGISKSRGAAESWRRQCSFREAGPTTSHLTIGQALGPNYRDRGHTNYLGVGFFGPLWKEMNKVSKFGREPKMMGVVEPRGVTIGMALGIKAKNNGSMMSGIRGLYRK